MSDREHWEYPDEELILPPVNQERLAALARAAEAAARRGELQPLDQPASSRGLTSLKGSFGKHSVVDLPPQPCRSCGKMMTKGLILNGEPVYTAHYASCELSRQQDERSHRARVREELRRLEARERVSRWNHHELGDQGFPEYCEARDWDGDRRQARTLADHFLAQVGDLCPSGFIVFSEMGGDGSGLVRALGRSLVELGRGVVYWDCDRLYNAALRLQQGGGMPQLMQDLQESEVLILDGMGRERASGWFVDRVLYAAVNERARQGRPIVGQTDHTAEGLLRAYHRTGTRSAWSDGEMGAAVNADALLKLLERVSPPVVLPACRGELARRTPQEMWPFLRIGKGKGR